MSRYDTRTTTFSQEGRLFQIEYALEAINNAPTTLSIVTKEGIIFAADRITIFPLIDSQIFKEKIYQIDSHCLCAIAGLSADAYVILDQARIISQRYLHKFNELIPVEDLVLDLCDIMQSYTQYGGLRPFGVSIIIGSYTEESNYQLFMIDPAGNYTSWKATALGQNNASAQTILKEDWNENLSLNDGLLLAMKILKTIGDSGTKNKETEIGILYNTDNGIKQKFLTKEECSELYKNLDDEEKKRTQT